MKIRTAIAALLALAAPALAQEAGPAVPSTSGLPALVAPDGTPLEPTMLHLRDGNILWGAIESHDAESIVVQRLLTGGRVRLSWGFLDPVQEEELRTQFGYVDVDVEEIEITAHRIELVDGTELFGLIVNHTPEEVHIKTSTSMVILPTNRLGKPPVLTRMPASDVYTREELYQQKVEELAIGLAIEGPGAAPYHLELAAYCERILDFTHALAHYVTADELDPQIISPELRNVVDRTAVKAKAQAQVDLLAEADTWRARKQFDRALAICDDFVTRYSDSPLMEDQAKLRERILIAQEKALRDQVVKKWHFWLSRLTSQAARDMGYSEALGYLDGRLREEIIEKIIGDLQDVDDEIDADRIQAFWLDRGWGKSRRASYGLGTWMLGADKAREQFKKPKEPASSGGSSRDDARAKLEEKINRYIKQQQSNAQARSASGTEQDPEKYWKTLTSSSRAQWMRAYYAENSGDMEVTGIRFSNCRACGGSGVREIFNAGGAGNQGNNAGGFAILACETCQTVGVVRRVVYR